MKLTNLKIMWFVYVFFVVTLIPSQAKAHELLTKDENLKAIVTIDENVLRATKVALEKYTEINADEFRHKLTIYKHNDSYIFIFEEPNSSESSRGAVNSPKFEVFVSSDKFEILSSGFSR